MQLYFGHQCPEDYPYSKVVCLSRLVCYPCPSSIHEHFQVETALDAAVTATVTIIIIGRLVIITHLYWLAARGRQDEKFTAIFRN